MSEPERSSRRDDAPVVRPTVRVLLVDDEGRTLLFRGVDEDGHEFWFPPGGGIEAGESVERAARRELLEETGRDDAELGPHLWDRRHVFRGLDGIRWDLREVWLLGRTAAYDIDLEGWTDVERDFIREHRWWSVEEMGASDDLMTPRDLADRLAEILAGHLPPEPVEIGL